MKFISDSMLGRLARWLRLSGYDVLYLKSDANILDVAKSENRIILSRDKKLCSFAEKNRIRTVLIESGDIEKQLKQLVNALGIHIHDAPLYARCPKCNAEVEKVDKEKIKAEVPDTVFENISEFWICKSCGKVYWHGGHWKNIKEVVRRIIDV